MNRYEKMFERLKARGEGAFVPFVMLGDPDLATSLEIIETLIANGADALELGIPFSDPIADGPVIQRSAMRALAAGVTPRGCLEGVAAIRSAHPEIPIGLLLYSNLVVHPGIDAFYQQASSSGVDSVLVADVPTYEAAPFVAAARKHKVCPVMIAPPNADDKRLKEIAGLGQGYTYVVTRSGVTGADAKLNLSSKHLLAKLREFGAPPAVFGFGISKPEHVRQALDEGASGAISGSAIVLRIEQNVGDKRSLLASVGAFVSEMKAATHLK
jgi:tryptophan synthase alpha chain